MKRTIALALLGAMVLVGSATAQAPAFVNGALVARKMEAHYNGPAYKARLAQADGKVTKRILCAHDPVLRIVQCSGRIRVSGVTIKAEWELEKRTTLRAKLRWTMSGTGVFDSDSQIVAPGAFGLTRF